MSFSFEPNHNEVMNPFSFQQLPQLYIDMFSSLNPQQHPIYPDYLRYFSIIHFQSLRPNFRTIDPSEEVISVISLSVQEHKLFPTLDTMVSSLMQSRLERLIPCVCTNMNITSEVDSCTRRLLDTGHIWFRKTGYIPADVYLQGMYWWFIHNQQYPETIEQAIAYTNDLIQQQQQNQLLEQVQVQTFDEYIEHFRDAPLSDEAINCLPKVVCTNSWIQQHSIENSVIDHTGNNTIQKTPPVCTICADVFWPNDVSVRLNCGHYFHAENGRHPRTCDQIDRLVQLEHGEIEPDTEEECGGISGWLRRVGRCPLCRTLVNSLPLQNSTDDTLEDEWVNETIQIASLQ